MSAALQRVTTAYVADEDRLRLTGELSDGDAVVLWLTQRLLNRLVPHLTAWLARQTGSFASTVPPAIQSAHHNIVQGFAQQSARAQLKPEPPVRAASTAAGWRVESVDVAQGEAGVALTFKGEAGEQAVLTMAAQPLRQWLSIVYEQVVRAEWPTTAWPAWMEAAASPAQNQPRTAVLH